MDRMQKVNTCVVGATGLVGQTMLKILDEYDFPIGKLKLLASKRSVGKKVNYKDKEYQVEELTEDSFDGYDLALFSAGGSVSLAFAPIAKKKGLLVIDNSSAWRENPEIPLIVPEVNLADHTQNQLIANPNCSTIQSVLPLKALVDTFGIKKVNYSTYQAVSGSGIKGLEDLEQTNNGQEPKNYPYPISETAIPEIDVFMADGYTKEERKMINETRKILHLPNLPVSATCVRIPVKNGHGVSIAVELGRTFTLEEVKDVLAKFPGITVIDDGEKHEYPTSTKANGTDRSILLATN